MAGGIPFWLFELVLMAFMSVSAWSLGRTVRQLDQIERRLRAAETRMAVIESELFRHRLPYVFTEAGANG